MLWAFSPSHFLKKIKKSKTSQTFYFILKAKKPNSRTTTDSSSIKLSKEIDFFFPNFKQMEVVEFEASF